MYIGQGRAVGDGDIRVCGAVVGEADQVSVSWICHVGFHIGEDQARLGIDVITTEVESGIIQRRFIRKDAHGSGAGSIARSGTIGLLGGQNE